MSRFFSLQTLTIIGIAAFLCCFSAPIQAQEDNLLLEDVVYLNNGSIIRGTLIELKMNEYVKIEDRAGNTWVFNYTDVSKVVKEPAQPSTYKQTKPPRSSHKFGSDPGFYMGLDLGFNLGSTNNGNGFSPTYASSVLGTFQVSAGYQFKNKITLGLASGIEGFGVMTLPIMVDSRYYFFKETFTPFVYLQGGMAHPLDDFAEYETGFGGGLGLGMRRQIGSNTGFTLSAGYRYLRLVSKNEFTPWGSVVTSRQLNIFNRVTMRFGIIF